MRFLIVLVAMTSVLGCTRMESKSKVSIQMPDRSSFLKSISKQAALPTNKKICFGVNVTGPGIDVSTSGITCGGVGMYSGFVGEGETLEIAEVPKGPKTFELLVYLEEPANACPQFLIPDVKNNRSKLYSSGTASADINSDTTVNIALNYPGDAHSLATACVSLKAKLLANGDLFDSNDSKLADSSPTNEGYFKTPFSGPLSLGVISSGGYVNIISDNLKVPNSLHSLTQKPDTGAYYALRHDNSIVKVNLTGGALEIEEIAAGTCPFQVVGCKVPLWVQSISAGYLTDLFGLDHAGGIYSLTSSGPVVTPVNVGPNVSQVSYY